jgi:predicted SAM-dependent methyltransferase
MIMRAIAARLLEWAKATLRRLRGLVRAVLYYGKGRFCPVCGKSSRRFRSAGLVPREDAQCVHCGALERHRLLWLYVSSRTNLFDGKPKKMLHVAPELCFESILRQRLGDNYITADLFSPRAMVKMDVTNIDYPDQSFDVIYCSHVLEHVQDDRKAIREFYRTLKSNGWAILLVPITAEETFEDPSIIGPEERLRVFGQEDHVRRYGPDYVDRLRDAGFSVEVTRANDLVQNGQILRMGLTSASGEIYYCTKQCSGN